MNHPRHLLCQTSLRGIRAVSRFRSTGHGRFDGLDLGERQERQHLQEADDVDVPGREEVLVELVRRQSLRGQPHNAALGLAELLPFAVHLFQKQTLPSSPFGKAGRHQQRKSEALCRRSGLVRWPQPFHEIQSCRDVAPLIGASDLQLDAASSTQVIEVVSLQELVGEFGEAQAAAAVLRRQSRFDRVLAHHGSEPGVFADVPQEVQQPHLPEPVQVVHELQRRAPGCRVFCEDLFEQ